MRLVEPHTSHLLILSSAFPLSSFSIFKNLLYTETFPYGRRERETGVLTLNMYTIGTDLFMLLCAFLLFAFATVSTIHIFDVITHTHYIYIYIPLSLKKK